MIKMGIRYEKSETRLPKTINTTYDKDRLGEKPMIDEDAVAVCGRKKRYGLLPRQGRLVIEFLSENGGEWKESQVINNLRDTWGRDGIDRGKITFFCRCAKDKNGKHIFTVSGNRPRSITYRPIGTR
jgi:hypothetical protein